MSQASSAVTQVYAPTFGPGAPVPTPPVQTVMPAASASAKEDNSLVYAALGALTLGVIIFITKTKR